MKEIIFIHLHPCNLRPMKYFYLIPRLGLKAFSAIQPPFMMSFMNGVVTIMGKFAGWGKLVNRFS
jgi:hypothetical protein